MKLDEILRYYLKHLSHISRKLMNAQKKNRRSERNETDVESI